MFDALIASLQQLGTGFVLACIVVGWIIVFAQIRSENNEQIHMHTPDDPDFFNKIEDFRRDFS